MDVRMPDGTIIQNVPDNITKQQLLDKFDRATQAGFFGTPASPTPTPQPPVEDQSFLRSVADVPLKFTGGAIQGVKMISDAFGAENPVSKALGGMEEYVAELYSAQSKNDSEKVARIWQEVQDKGIAEQVGGAIAAFATAPVDLLSQALGTIAPTVASGLLGTAMKFAPAAVRAVQVGTGSTMGAGVVKGSIYDAVKEELAKTPMDPEQVEARAKLAQEYGGQNLDMILSGAALGGLAAAVGVEPSLTRMTTAKILKAASTKEGADAVAQAAAKQGLVSRSVRAGAAEAVPEVLQGGQEQLAQNIALQREGFDTPTGRGVVFGGALEGLAGAGLGSAVGAIDTRSQRVAKIVEELRRTSEEDPELKALLDGLDLDNLPDDPDAADAELERAAMEETAKKAVDEGNLTPKETKEQKRQLAEDAETQEIMELLKQDEIKRSEIEALKLESDLVSTDARLTDAQTKKTEKLRRGIMLPIIESADTSQAEKLVDTIEGALKKAGLKDFNLTMAEKKLVAKAANVILAEEPGPIKPLPPEVTEPLDTGGAAELEALIPEKRAERTPEQIGIPGVGQRRVKGTEPAVTPQAVTPEFLDTLGISPSAPMRKRLQGMDMSSPEVEAELRAYANNSKVSKKAVDSINRYLNDIPAEQGDMFLDRQKKAPIKTADKAMVTPEPTPKKEAPIVKYRREAAEIEAKLPPVPKGHTRLWRGNRPGEVGKNPQFTNSLDGIALPFRDAYKGPLSYVDVPNNKMPKAATGAAASDSEFALPMDVAATAKLVDAAPESTPAKTKKDKKQAVGKPDPVAEAAVLEEEVTDLPDFDAIAEQEMEVEPAPVKPAKAPKTKKAAPEPVQETGPVAEFVQEPEKKPAGKPRKESARPKDFTEEVDILEAVDDELRAEERPERQKQLIQAQQAAEKALAVMEMPFDPGEYASFEDSVGPFEEIMRQRIIALANAYRIVGNPDYVGTKAAALAEYVLKHPSVALMASYDTLMQYAEKHKIPFSKLSMEFLEHFIDQYEGKFESYERELAKDISDKETTSAWEFNKNDRFEFLRYERYATSVAGGHTSNEADPEFGNFTNAVQAMNHIEKTGNAFEKLLAQRLKPFLKGVQLVRVDKYDDIKNPAIRTMMLGHAGLYVEGSEGSRTIYLSNIRPFNGLSARTILHEALHGGTFRKIDLFMDAKTRDKLTPRELRAIDDMQNTMIRAYAYYQRLKTSGRSNPRLSAIAEAGAFTKLHEFVAYGLTEPDMQDFLSQVPGIYDTKGMTERGLLSRFVAAVRNLFNMGPQFSTALQDLVITTDELMGTPNLSAFPKQDLAAASRKIESVGETMEKLGKSSLAEKQLLEVAGVLANKTRVQDPNIDLLKVVGGTLKTNTKKKILPFLTTDDIVRWAGDRLPLLGLTRRIEAMQGARNKRIRKLAEDVEGWVEFNKNSEEAGRLLADTMHVSSLLEVDPTKYKTVSEALSKDTRLARLNRRANNPKLTLVEQHDVGKAIQNREERIRKVYSMWDAVGKYDNGKGHKIYRMAKDQYAKTLDEHNDLLVANIKVMQLSPEAESELLGMITANYQKSKQLEVYFPLMRYGNYWVRVGEGQDSEFYMFESSFRRDIFVAKLRAEFERDGDTRDVEAGDEIGGMRNDITNSSQLLTKMFGAIDATGSKNIDAEALKENIYQMYLMTLPERDIRKRFTRRQGKAGFSGDALRNYIVAQHSAANQLARLEHANPVRNELDAMQAKFEKDPQRTEVMPFIEEMRKRVDMAIRPDTPGEFDWDKLATLGNQVVFFYMLTSPRSAIVQLTQIPMVAMPVLAARYGTAKTAKVTARYSNIFKMYSTTQTAPDGTVKTKWGFPSLENSKYIRNHPDPEYALNWEIAWEEAQERDLFMQTFVSDMAGRERAPTENYHGPLSTGARATLNFMSGAFHNMESMARKLAFSAGYEMEYEVARKEGLSTDAARDRATQVAFELVHETLFNYTQFNKPRLMHEPLVRLATQFMTYPLQMTSYLVRNFFNMLRSLPMDQRKDAAVKFFGTMGMTTLFAGVTGLPQYSAIMGLLTGMREMAREMWDDDEREFYEDDKGNPLGKVSLDLWMRESFIPEYFGAGSGLAEFLGLTDEQADLMSRSVKMGPLSALTDLNIGVSTSLDGLWFKQDARGDTQREAWESFVYNTMTGPFGSMTANFAGALDDFNSGHISRGVEKLLPAFVRGAATALRLENEGFRTRQGAEVQSAEWFTTGKLIGQAFGFQSTEIADVQTTNFLAKKIEQDILKKRAKLLDVLDRAVQVFDNNGTAENDAAIEKVLADIEEYNYKFGVHAIGSSTIKESLENRAKNRAGAYQGLIVAPALAPYIYGQVENSRSPEYK